MALRKVLPTIFSRTHTFSPVNHTKQLAKASKPSKSLEPLFIRWDELQAGTLSKELQLRTEQELKQSYSEMELLQVESQKESEEKTQVIVQEQVELDWQIQNAHRILTLKGTREEIIDCQVEQLNVSVNPETLQLLDGRVLSEGMLVVVLSYNSKAQRLEPSIKANVMVTSIEKELTLGYALNSEEIPGISWCETSVQLTMQQKESVKEFEKLVGERTLANEKEWSVFMRRLGGRAFLNYVSKTESDAVVMMREDVREIVLNELTAKAQDLAHNSKG